MLRTIAALATLSLLAGCIQVPEDASELEAAAAPEDIDRIDGMTADESITDNDVDCDEGGLLSLPRFCAERVLLVTGRMGLDELIVALDGENGAISIFDAPEDTWSFTATVRVSALTQEQAREGLDTAWAWSHEDSDGTHAIRAAPTPTTDVVNIGADVVSTKYELALPHWVVLELDLQTDNGEIVVRDRIVDDADIATENGQIILSGDVRSVHAATENGQLLASLRPTGSGEIDLSSENGQVLLKLAEDRAHGYDIDASSENGQILIRLRDCETSVKERSTSAYPGNQGQGSCTSSGYEKREIQTKVVLETENGQIIVTPL